MLQRVTLSLALTLVLTVAAGCGAEEHVGEATQAITATQQAKLLASDGNNGDLFGSAAAISGDTALIGAYYADQLAFATGAAYVYTRTGATWTQQARILEQSSIAAGETFGNAVALSGDTALIGAMGAMVNGKYQGAASVHRRSGTAWPLEARLVADDGVQGNSFGAAVALSGDTAVVGDPRNNGQYGAAYVFVRTGTTWTQQAKLVAPGGSFGDHFGAAVAVSGDTVIVGAPDETTNDDGAAYVFERTGTTWAQTQKITANNSSKLGSTIAISGPTALISTRVYERSGGMWTFQALLGKPSAPIGYGAATALGKDVALVSAPFENGGSTHVFTRSGTTWTEALIVAPGAANGTDQIGQSVALSGSTVILGASRDDAQGMDSGAAYAFVIQGLTGGACAGATDCASGFCVGGVCCDQVCTGACQVCSAAEGATADGTCTPVGGEPCDDGDACTHADTCQAGTCTGEAVTCAPPDECHELGACAPSSGQCAYPTKPDGTPCSAGLCTAGVCIVATTASSSSSSGGGTSSSGGTSNSTSSSGGAGGGGGGASMPGTGGGCGCRTGPSDGSAGTMGLVIAIAVGMARRRGRRSDRSRGP